MFENIKCFISRKTEKANLILDPLCAPNDYDTYNDRNELRLDLDEEADENVTEKAGTFVRSTDTEHSYCLNKLQITKRLDFVDSGTFFIWKKGYSRKYDKDVNIKIISCNTDNVDAINNEITLWNTLSTEKHENILNVLEHFESRHFKYVITNISDGLISLYKYLYGSNGAFSETQARKIFQGIISAVEFCHDKGIAHRDIKPQHLLVGRTNQVKLSGKNYVIFI